MNTVHVVLPNDIDDPAKPSGGNVYDRRICDGLAGLGWTVREHCVPGAWPWPGTEEVGGLARVLQSISDGSLVLLDGLVASAVPEALVAQASRLRLVVLMHMPLGDAREALALSAAEAVVTTSFWSRARLLDLYGLPADRVHVAQPGVVDAPPAPGSPTGSQLLCVAALAPHKGHDLLVEALARIAALPWSCVFVGSLELDRGFADAMRRRADALGIAERISFAGPASGAQLAARYSAADLLVLASRGESYGMVVTEALARGIPVLATEVGGLPEALGRAPDGSLPGMLVPPDDPADLAGGLRRWLQEPELRRRLAQSARARRDTLDSWAETSLLVAKALDAQIATSFNAHGPLTHRE